MAAVQSRRHLAEQAWACAVRFLPSGVTAHLLRQVNACALSRCLSFARAQQMPGSSCGRGMPPRPSRIQQQDRMAGQGQEQPGDGTHCLL